MRLFTLLPAAMLLAGVCSPTAHGHFIWLLPESGDSGTVVQVYFGEDASPDDPALLQRLKGLSVWQLGGDQPQELPVTLTEESLTAKAAAAADDSLFVASHDLGVFDRGDSVFRLIYHAKSGPEAAHPAWNSVDCSDHLALDVVPQREGRTVTLTVRFQGQPVPDAQIVAARPGLDDVELLTDAAGQVKFDVAESGVHSIRARVILPGEGEFQGKSYAETRHYSTIALPIELSAGDHNLQPLPQTVTSFGGALLGNFVYVYGGHTGGAHSYCLTDQERHLRRLNLTTGKWDVLAEGPPLQGLALVGHEDRLYRIGGFTARNAEGEDHDLWSSAEVAAFDLTQGKWQDMPPLPEPRSSFDAAVLDGTIYVIGGWALAGDADNHWHTTAWAMDVTAETPYWKELPAPPFQRRALAIAAHAGRIYVIGGMQEDGGPTRRVDVFDPQSETWSTGPELVGDDGFTGFGAAAFATGGRLYASTVKGTLQRLSTDGQQWEVLGDTPTARFFHRLLPLDKEHLLVVGGANMQIGKFEDVEILPVPNDGT